MHPAAGQGAVNAIQDATVLANVLVSLPSRSPQLLTKTFEDYRSERYPPGACCIQNEPSVEQNSRQGVPRRHDSGDL
ncbi:MAG: hypothetical protein BYD32DRAFT_488664 [Podila humilis]|nr:MAG: hypothetical protein BYD32DRAFT_488664 [Podila humilis]